MSSCFVANSHGNRCVVIFLWKTKQNYSCWLDYFTKPIFVAPIETTQRRSKNQSMLLLEICCYISDIIFVLVNRGTGHLRSPKPSLANNDRFLPRTRLHLAFVLFQEWVSSRLFFLPLTQVVLPWLKCLSLTLAAFWFTLYMGTILQFLLALHKITNWITTFHYLHSRIICL